MRYSVIGLEIGFDGAGTRREKLDSLLVGEWWHGVFLLAGQVERLPTRDEEVEVRACGEQLGQLAGRLDDLLEVVEQHQRRAVTDVLGETVVGAERVRGRCRDELRVAEGGERHPPDALRVAVGEATGRLKREAGFSCASRAGQRQQAHVVA